MAGTNQLAILSVALLLVTAGCAGYTSEDFQGWGSQSTNVPPPSSIDASEIDSANASKIERLIHRFINQKRAELGLEPLTFSNNLQFTARNHSRYMAETRYQGHRGPDGQGVNARLEDYGIYCSAAEVVTTTFYNRTFERWPDNKEVHYDTEREVAKDVVRQWMESRSHKDAIMDGGYSHGGAGVYVTEEGVVKATYQLCSSRPSDG